MAFWMKDSKIRSHRQTGLLQMRSFHSVNRGTKAKDKQFTFRLPTENISIFQKLELDLVILRIIMP